MFTELRHRLSQLFREVEVDMGSTQLSFLVLKSLEESLKNWKSEDLHEFFQQLIQLTNVVNTTEPRFASIIDAFSDVLKLAYEEEIHHPEAGARLEKKKFLHKIQKIRKEKQLEHKKIIHNALDLKVQDKGILVYDHSRTVQGVLAGLKSAGKSFRVIVAEQDHEKTNAVIESLHAADISFRVVPSYMISHLEDQIDMVFLGGLTLKSSLDFVMDPGTSAIVSQFHLLGKDIYAFIATTKFSMWKSERSAEIYAHVQRRKHFSKNIEFERVKFSHDRIPLNFFKGIVTEQGIATPKQIEKIYKEKFAERTLQEKRFQADLKRIQKDH